MKRHGRTFTNLRRGLWVDDATGLRINRWNQRRWVILGIDGGQATIGDLDDAFREVAIAGALCALVRGMLAIGGWS